MTLKGIDVSEHQGHIDWAKVAKDGVQFAIIRAGYGRELKQKDKQFERNYAGAKATGIKVGAYWYSYADSVKRAEDEAKTCLKVLEGKTFELPVFFDQEYEKSILALSTKTRTDIALKFLETVKEAGRKVGLYSSTNFITTKLQANRLSAYPLWLATPARFGRGSTPAKGRSPASRATWTAIMDILGRPTPATPTCSARGTRAMTSGFSSTDSTWWAASSPRKASGAYRRTAL